MANCKDIVSSVAALTDIKDTSGVKILSKNCTKLTFEEVKQIIEEKNKYSDSNKEMDIVNELLMAIACVESGGLKDKTSRTILFDPCAHTEMDGRLPKHKDLPKEKKDKLNSTATGLMGITKGLIADAQKSGFISSADTPEVIHARLCGDAAYSVEIAVALLQRKINIARRNSGEASMSSASDEKRDIILKKALASYGTGTSYANKRISERDSLLESYTETKAQGFSWGEK